MKRFLCVPAIAAACFASEEITLQSGFRLSADRIEYIGETARLHTSGGTVDFPRISIASIEHIDAPAQAPAVLAVPQPAALAVLQPAKSPREHLTDAAAATGLPLEFLLSIAKVESAFRPDALSPKGAIGVMQLMPGTARSLNVNPYDLRENIDGGARLLRELLLKYENYPDQVHRALSAYNAGEGAVKKYDGIPPYRETRQYVDKVLNEYHRLKSRTP